MDVTISRLYNVCMNFSSYTLIDSGHGRKLEKFGPFLISRPAAQAVWSPQLADSEWLKADAVFTRESENRWIKKTGLPETWTVTVSGVTFKIAPTDFGHLGIFPEQRPFWDWLASFISKQKQHRSVRVLNLFAYSGGATLAAAKGGAEVCHLDASKGMVAWARENAGLSHLEKAPIRWIIDDVSKFLLRELRRESRYDGIILDPPSFGRGSKGEIFKIEGDLIQLLQQCRDLLSQNPLFLLLSCHTPGYTALAMEHLMRQTVQGLGGRIDTGEMVLTGEKGVLALPSGSYARWIHEP